MQEANYRTTVIKNLSEISSAQWEKLRSAEFNGPGNPFLSYAYLHAMEKSGCATAATGWTTHYLTIWQSDELMAAMPLYLKSHSYGEYVFDWSWANAFEQHNLPYYPKLLSAIPFTPVSGARLLATDEVAFKALLAALVNHTRSGIASSCHVLFLPDHQAKILENAGFMLRFGVQFHWTNLGYHDFSDFLAQLESKKRKNILAERRKVNTANITFKHKVGQQISRADWSFFVECYNQTYYQHGGIGYLNLAFFLQLSTTMPENLLLITAYRNEQPIAASLLFVDHDTVYGRYWGCLEYHPCLHFETAYYQPLEFCIANQIKYFEGGAQGEHKMARGFLPMTTYSAHRIHHPEFAEAIERFLKREQIGMDNYINELNDHNPYGNNNKTVEP
ncbi:putative N-acyltransferase [Oxalobacteraceae bacterium GrIS 2.11]